MTNKIVFTLLLILAFPVFGQQSITLSSPPPPPVSSVSAAPAGATGNTTECYWVIAIYPIGQAFPGGPGCTGSAGFLAGGTVTVNWTLLPGATGYNVLRTSSSSFPTGGSCTNCLLSSNATAGPVTDTGASLASFTISNTPAASGVIQLNNRDYPTPRFVGTVPVTTPNQGVTFSQLGTVQNGVQIYCTDCVQANPCTGSGTGAFAQGIAGAWDCGGGGGGGTGPTILTAGVNNTSQSQLNFVGSSTNAVGLVATPSNPSGGNEKIEITGTPNNVVQSVAGGADNHIAIGGTAINPVLSFAYQAGDLPNIPGTLATSQLISTMPLITTGSGAPTAACSIVNQPQLYIETDANNFFLWYCAASAAGGSTTGWQRIASSTANGIGFSDFAVGTYASLAAQTGATFFPQGTLCTSPSTGSACLAMLTGLSALGSPSFIQNGIGSETYLPWLTTPDLQTGAGYTISCSTDAFGLVSVSNAGAQTLNAPATVCPKGVYFDIQNTGAGTWSLSGNTHNIDGSASTISIPTNAGLRLISNGTAWFTERGISGGTGTGTVTTSGSPASGQLAQFSGPTAITTATNPALSAASTGSAITQGYTSSGTTTAGLIAKINGNDTIVTVGTTDTEAAGIVQTGAANGSTALLAVSGTAACTFDNASTAGHYVQISTGTTGDCHDAGATLPTAGGTILGRVADGGAAGSHNVTLAVTPPGASAGSTTVTTNLQTGTSYTVVTGDQGKLISFNSTTVVAVTLPQCTSAGFAAGWFMHVGNIGRGPVIITPTTSTIDGQTSITLRQNQGVAEIACDTGGNYFTDRFQYDPNDPQMAYWRDDFTTHSLTSGSLGEQGWTNTTISGACTPAQIAGVFPNLGLLNFPSNAAASSSCSLGFAAASVATTLGAPGNYAPWQEKWIIKLSQTTNNRMRFGFGVSAASVTGGNSGFFIRLDQNATAPGGQDTNWTYETRTGAASTISATTVAPDTNFHTLTIASDTAGKLIFTIDGANRKTFCSAGCDVTATIDTSNMEALAIVGNDTTASSSAAVFDFWSYKVLVSTASDGERQ